MALSELTRGIPGLRLEGDPGWQVTGIGLDSRRVQPGHLFAALAGRAADGRSFAAAAVGAGACAVLAAPPRPEMPADAAWLASDAPRRTLALLCRRFWGAPDLRTRVIGITGTDGKTTTAAMIAAALRADGRRAATVGTLGLQLGDRVDPGPLTTPEAPDLWPFLARAADGGIDAVALEASSVGLAADRVHGVRFAAGVLTSMGRDHLDLHGTKEAYRAAKRSLFESLDEDAVAILPVEPEFDDFRRSTRARVVTFGGSPSANWSVSGHRPGTAGATFTLRGPGVAELLASPRPGPWDARNVACAAAVAASLGADPVRAARGAAGCRDIAGRWQTIDEGQPWLAVVDYAHTPDALARVLRLARRVAAGQVIVVFGCGGERDAGKRPLMGGIAARTADVVIVTDDNPRREDPEAIAREIIDGTADGPARVERVADRGRAIVRAVDAARPGDVVVIAGKGHERTQEVGGTRLAFDDREALCAAIRTSGTQE